MVVVALLAAGLSTFGVEMAAQAVCDAHGAETARVKSSIGAGAGATSVVFVRPAAVLPLEGGRVAVLDSGEPAVKFFDAQGRQTAVVGGRGQGPGEFLRPTGMGGRDGRIWVVDSGLRRLSVFLGSPPSYERAFTHGRVGAHPVAILGGEWVLTRSAVGTREVAGGNPTVAYALSNGADIDTVLVADLSRSIIDASRGGRNIMGPEPFADGDIVAVAPGGRELVLVERRVDQPRAVVTRVNLKDGTTLRVAVSLPRIALTDALVEEARDALPESLREPLGEAMFVPSRIPPVRAALVGVDGGVWLKSALSEDGRGGSASLWCRLSEEGGVDVRLMVADSAEPLAAAADRIWAVERREMDIPVVVELVWPGRE